MSNKIFDIQKFDFQSILETNSIIYCKSIESVKKVFKEALPSTNDIFEINERQTLNDLIERQKTLFKLAEKKMLSDQVNIKAHFIVYDFPSELNCLIPSFKDLSLSYTIVKNDNEIIDGDLTHDLKYVLLFNELEESVLNDMHNQYVKQNLSFKTFKKTYKSCVQDDQSCLILHQNFSTENPIEAKIFWFDLE